MVAAGGSGVDSQLGSGVDSVFPAVPAFSLALFLFFIFSFLDAIFVVGRPAA